MNGPKYSSVDVKSCLQERMLSQFISNTVPSENSC